MIKIINFARKIIRNFGIDIVRYRGDFYHEALYKELFDIKVLTEKRLYNIGAGSFFHPYWTNIDFVSKWYGSVQQNVVHYDLMSLSPLPIRDGLAEIIYTSHTIEHVTEAAVKNLFFEVFRALRPGGIFRVTTGPDAETDFRALMLNDENWFYWDLSYQFPGTFEHIYRLPAASVPLAERWLHHVCSQLAPNDLSPSNIKFTADSIVKIISESGMDGALDYFTSLCTFNPDRPGNHISWWTHDKVILFLREAGFVDVYRSGYRQSRHPVLRTDFFDSTHPQMSIYVEAVKHN